MAWLQHELDELVKIEIAASVACLQHELDELAKLAFFVASVAWPEHELDELAKIEIAASVAFLQHELAKMELLALLLAVFVLAPFGGLSGYGIFSLRCSGLASSGLSSFATSLGFHPEL